MYIDLLRKQWVELYGAPEPATRLHWDRYVEYLKRVVPEKRLVFYDVKEGWEPLCRFLGRKVPEEGFPRLNERGSIREAERSVQRESLKKIARNVAVVGAIPQYIHRMLVRL